MILVDSEKAKEYIDKLLWSQPPDSFLPHSGELITIGTQLSDTVTDYFNLTAPALIGTGLRRIYEFDDQTSPDKQAAFKQRYERYKENAYPMATL